ncbi:MAG: hypothetical protein M1404_05920 [Acidobacteria bacterium]|nr:hypothetical protein [Acidobacteriota bacterium]
MREWSSLTIGVVAGAAGVLAGAGTLVYLKLRRRKDPAELERLRRFSLSRTGRIATGEIISLVEPEGQNASAVLLVYQYDVAGVTYEVAQDVAPLPAVAALASRAVGQEVIVKYEMKRPGNSIIISEEWSGLPDVKPAGTAAPSLSAEVAEKP